MKPLYTTIVSALRRRLRRNIDELQLVYAKYGAVMQPLRTRPVTSLSI
jgi:hypothetical protein